MRCQGDCRLFAPRFTKDRSDQRWTVGPNKKTTESTATSFLVQIIHTREATTVDGLINIARKRSCFVSEISIMRNWTFINLHNYSSARVKVSLVVENLSLSIYSRLFGTIISRAQLWRFSLRLSFWQFELSWLSQFDLFTVLVWAGFTCTAAVVVKLESQVQSSSFYAESRQSFSNTACGFLLLSPSLPSVCLSFSFSLFLSPSCVYRPLKLLHRSNVL